MDPHPDDLSELERRLATRAPSSAGLDADAMLFAAGRASARPGRARFLWPGLAASLAALAAVLGVWLAVERSERLSLAERLRQPAPTSEPSPLTAPSEPPTADEPGPAPSSVLAARRALRQGLDAWGPAPVPRDDRPAPPPADSPVLRVGRSANLPDL
jgi:hypothetical protein